VANRHDTGTKTILGQTANFDADSFADLLVAQPAHPIFLARRLWYRFASGEPLPAATQTRLVSAYGGGRDVSAMVRALLADPEFPGTRGALVKQPVEWLVGAVRQLGIDPGALPDNQRRPAAGRPGRAGPAATGPAQRGRLAGRRAWLTTSSLQVRLRLAAALAAAASQATVDTVGSGSTDAKLTALARILVVDAWTDRTRAALSDVASDARKLLTVGLASPEYTVS
jgi:uncharacterized protein (DUF1800 family)